VNNTKENLLFMHPDIKYEQIIDKAKQFCEAHDLPKKDFITIRSKKRNRQIDQNTEEVNLNSPFKKHKINTYFMSLDKITSSFLFYHFYHSRFSDAKDIMIRISISVTSILILSMVAK